MKQLISFLLFLSLPQWAWAQEDLDAAADEAGVESVAAGDSAKEARSTSEKDASVYVVQRRAYSKKKKVELTPEFFFSANNKFVGYVGASLSAAYHFKENFALEINVGAPFLRYYSDLVYEIRTLKPRALEPQRVDLKQMTFFASMSAQFSALYGKFNLFGLLVDYDFFLSAGPGVVTTVEVCQPFGRGDCGDQVDGLGFGQRIPQAPLDQIKFAGVLGGGLRVFFADFVGLKVELRNLIYADRSEDRNNEVSTDIRSNTLVFLGASFLL